MTEKEKADDVPVVPAQPVLTTNNVRVLTTKEEVEEALRRTSGMQ